MIQIASKRNILILISCCYAFLSKFLLDKVYLTSTEVVDELYHIPQGLKYCHHNFKSWNPHITTLPGLYLYSTLICSSIGACNVYCLRFTILIAASINLLLFFFIIEQLQPRVGLLKQLLSAVNLSLLPPLYFFSFVYYTDVPALSTVLGLYYFSLKRQYVIAGVFGISSILMRQTNIVYVLLFGGMIMIGTVFNLFCNQYKFKNDITSIHKKDFKKFKYSLKIIKSFLRWPVVIEFSCYGGIVLGFLIFLYINEGIVVGDRSAHTAVIHIPQYFYFILFCVVFSWPYHLKEIIPFLKHARRNWLYVFTAIPMISLIVYANTMVHRYLLADNRHYAFYIWKRIFEKSYFRYLLSPAYLFSFYSIFKRVANPANINFLILFVPASFVVLILQKLFEIRYFIIPYILLRLNFQNVNIRHLCLELIFYTILNVITFYIFFTKEIKWTDFEHIQRIIW